jgi:hypothetical protein
MTDQMLCPKCGGVMDEGYIPDRGYGAFHQPFWVPGKVIRSFLGVRVPGTSTYPTRQYRCTRCGFVETYAPEEVDYWRQNSRQKQVLYLLVILFFAMLCGAGILVSLMFYVFYM